MRRTTVTAGTLSAALLAGLLACGARRPVVPNAPEGEAGPVAGIYVYTMPRLCRSKMECSGNDDCVRPETPITRQGVCGIPIDAEGRVAGLNVRRVPQCALHTDCPPEFTCMRLSVQDGLCVR